MPAYNASNYIQEAINSIIAQSYTCWELIIVDDGSIDETAKIVQKNSKVDDRIKYFYQENGKQGKARNLGISKSRGEYLAFLDADDLWLPEKLTHQIDQIQKTNVDLVFANSYIFNNNNVDDISKTMNTPKDIIYDKDAIQFFLGGNRIPILTVLAKKDKIILAHGFSEKLSLQNAEDYHLWLKLLIDGAFFYSSKLVLASYRIHNQSSTTNDKSANKEVLEVFIDLRDKYPQISNMLDKAIKNNFRKKYGNNLFSKRDLNDNIYLNCKYLDKKKVFIFYKILNYTLPTQLTKRFLIHILNA
ncbi:MAG: glycosyltransferase family 2 protein [Candidatus Sericytochromatia bacterium]